MPTAGDMIPGGTTAQARKVADLERQVRELRAARRAENTSLSSGRFRVLRPDGTTIVGVGTWSDGSYGAELRRDDGTLAIGVSGQGADYDDMVRVFSRDGHTIVMDDAWADGFLGRPWIPIPMTPGVSFTHTTWATTHSGIWWRQHAVLDVDLSVYAPASTTAEMRLMARINGALVQLGATFTATNNQERFSAWRVSSTDLAGTQHGTRIPVIVQTQRTAGTGTCLAYVHGLYGSNTFVPDEA